LSKTDLLLKSEGPALLEIKVKSGARDDLGRPATDPVTRKKRFMEKMTNA
jgi:hypothetical protein